MKTAVYSTKEQIQYLKNEFVDPYKKSNKDIVSKFKRMFKGVERVDQDEIEFVAIFYNFIVDDFPSKVEGLTVKKVKSYLNNFEIETYYRNFFFSFEQLKYIRSSKRKYFKLMTEMMNRWKDEIEISEGDSEYKKAYRYEMAMGLVFKSMYEHLDDYLKNKKTRLVKYVRERKKVFKVKK